MKNYIFILSPTQPVSIQIYLWQCSDLNGLVTSFNDYNNIVPVQSTTTTLSYQCSQRLQQHHAGAVNNYNNILPVQSTTTTTSCRCSQRLKQHRAVVVNVYNNIMPVQSTPTKKTLCPHSHYNNIVPVQSRSTTTSCQCSQQLQHHHAGVVIDYNNIMPVKSTTTTT